MQVGSQKRRWLEGKCIAFNNSYLHSAFNQSSRTRCPCNPFPSFSTVVS
ncbi:MAG: aspartyl/asparaginyl beta-hydroxylase domain-containing protein [Pyrinomonadaceae bacterium]